MRCAIELLLTCALSDSVCARVAGNVATTRAEYLAVALDKAEHGFDSHTEAAEHATDMLLVRNAYEGMPHC